MALCTYPWMCVCFHARPIIPPPPRVTSWDAISDIDGLFNIDSLETNEVLWPHDETGPCRQPGCECKEFQPLVLSDLDAVRALLTLAEIPTLRELLIKL